MASLAGPAHATHRLLWVEARLVPSVRRLARGRTLPRVLLPVGFMPVMG